MARLSRRTFVGWMGALGALIGVRRAQAAPPSAGDAQPVALPAGALLALAQAVLPSELGPEGMARATREFTRWVAAYRAGTELLHPYGSDELSFAERLPVAAWREQLGNLDALARAQHGKGWHALGVAERQALVRTALAGAKVSGMPAVLRAPHIAVALMSHFYDSAAATDLCYGAQIGKNQCRPLVHNARAPLSLSRGGKA